MSPHSETLKNGLRVVYVPCEAESVAFGLFISSGSRYEEARVAGISHFIEHMLFKGTPTRRPIDITRAIEGRGGNFNAFTGEEATCYYAHLPDEYLNEAVEILGDMYLNASMPDDEFAREKQVVIEEIRMYADEPDAVAMENLQRSLFPCNPIGAPVAGSAAFWFVRSDASGRDDTRSPPLSRSTFLFRPLPKSRSRRMSTRRSLRSATVRSASTIRANMPRR